MQKRRALLALNPSDSPSLFLSLSFSPSLPLPLAHSQDEIKKKAERALHIMKSGKGLSTLRSYRSNDAVQSLGASYFTDNNDVPLARVLPRRDRFARITSSLTWSQHDSMAEAGPSTRSLGDADFAHKVLKTGHGHVTRVKCSQMLKGRILGTMGVEGEGKELGRGVEDVRVRQEHVERGVIGMPVLMGDEGDVRDMETGGNGLEIVRRAFLTELRDLYTIVGSMKVRQFDVGIGDVRGLFEWFVMFERFLRIYFVVSERWIYEESGIDEWAGLEGYIGGEQRRKKEKRRIVGLVDKVWRMKRMLEAVGEGEGMRKGVGELGRRVDEMTMGLVRYLKEEVEVGKVLEGRGMMAGVVQGMVRDMREMEGGKEGVVIVSRGLGKGGEMGRWLRQMLGGRGGRRWLWAVVDGHMGFVREFERAQKEYVAMYRGLSGLVDEQIRRIHH